MRVISAGDGYRYLLQSVAAGDGHRPLTTPLIRYYAEKGTPPGYWLGTRVHGVGTTDQRIEPGATVTEDHLRRLGRVKLVLPADRAGSLCDRQVRRDHQPLHPLYPIGDRARPSGRVEGPDELRARQVFLIGQDVEGPRIGQAGA